MLTILAQQIPENGLWTIVGVLAGVIAWGGKLAHNHFAKCVQDRDRLHKKVGKLAAICASKLHCVIDLDNLDEVEA